MKKKIYIVSFNSVDYPGGLENVVKNHIENYCEKIKKIITVISREESETLEKLNIEQVVIRAKDNNIIDKIFFINQIFFSLRVSLFILKNIRKYKKVVIHVHGIEYSGFLILINLMFKKCSLIVTAHGSLFLERLNYIKSKSIYLYLFLPIFLPSLIYDCIVNLFASKIVCISSNLEKYFYKISFSHNKIIIYNGMKVNRQPIKPDIKLDDSESIVYNCIIVGSTSMRKGLPLAIEVINKFNKINNHKKIKLHIVGFKDFDKLKLIKIINTKNINYVGVVTQKELFSIYKKMDFMILPSIYEGFPLTVLESLNLGVPFVVSKECMAQEINDHTKYGIIVSGRDVEDWVSGISNLLKQINYFQHNLQKAEFSNFSWNTISAQNETIYKTLLAG